MRRPSVCGKISLQTVPDSIARQHCTIDDSVTLQVRVRHLAKRVVEDSVVHMLCTFGHDWIELANERGRVIES